MHGNFAAASSDASKVSASMKEFEKDIRDILRELIRKPEGSGKGRREWLQSLASVTDEDRADRVVSIVRSIKDQAVIKDLKSKIC